MSAIIGLIAAAVVTRVVLPAGAKLVSKTLEGLSGKFAVNSGEPITASGHVHPTWTGESIKSVSQIRSEFKPIPTELVPDMNVEQAKQKILWELASRPFYTSDEASFKNKVDALKSAATLAEIETRSRDLIDSVEAGSQQVFADAVKSACQRATQKLGFSKIETMASPIRSGVMRFSATDDEGRTLVTEIDASMNKDVKIDTEVLGVTDNSCHQILENFHAALKEEGVIIGQPPKREATGGICTLAAAKDFLAKKVAPKEVDLAPNIDTRARPTVQRGRVAKPRSAVRTKRTLGVSS
jgi:hypothetical protein